MPLEIKTFSGIDASHLKNDVARLRITVFSEYPYLYDGSEAYEASYLEPLLSSDSAIIVAVFDRDSVVGVSTGLPLSSESDDILSPWSASEYAPSDIYYLSESVLLNPYRGKGIGRVFFSERLKKARNLGFRYASFCAVVRPDNHPSRPVNFQPLNGFWKRLGFEMVPGLTCKISWKEHGISLETPHILQFWIKTL
jgi:GNAT superfamily N-acetyltransferase